MWHKIKAFLLTFSIILFSLGASAECIEVPRGVTSNLDEQFSSLMRSAAPCDRVLLPATFSEFDPMGESMLVQEIEVQDNNPYFRTNDGVLFSLSMDTLVAYPMARQSLEYHVPEGTYIIGAGAFQYWHCDLPYEYDDWTQVDLVLTLPSSLLLIDSYAFSCASINQIAFPENLVHVGDHAFEECEWLSHITWPSSLKVIGSWAFCGCALTELDLPEGVEVINPAAFAVNPLEKVRLPRSLRYIDPNAFSDCYSLETFDTPTFEVYPNSYAEEWVMAAGYSYTLIQ